LRLEPLEDRLVLDNTLGTAFNIGTLVGRQSFAGFVGSSDTQDYYRFNLSAPGSFNALLDSGEISK